MFVQPLYVVCSSTRTEYKCKAETTGCVAFYKGNEWKYVYDSRNGYLCQETRTGECC